MSLRFHNQLTKRVDDFTPQQAGAVSLYTCGPTVYNHLHVGNWAAYVYWDTLVRVLTANDLTVTRVMNITDVGHLVSDGDDGEDKLEKGARREGKTAWEVAEYYTDDFLLGMERLNLLAPEYLSKATDYIDEQLALVRRLKEKGFTYQIGDGIYFDTARFPTYDDFAGLHLDAQKAGARVEFNPEKRQASDFALWKFTPADESRDMQWLTPSDLTDDGSEPYGFPGWHLECSAMAMSLLGETIDIHTGGIDHIPVHHTNEIAQSEAATGKPFAHFWLHNNHLKVNGTKISKSLDNGYTLDDLIEKGFSPLDVRLLLLQSHYRSEGNFTFDNLTAAKNRRHNWRNVAALRHQLRDQTPPTEDESTDNLTVALHTATHALVETLSDDLNTPETFKLIDEVFRQLTSHIPTEAHQPALQSFLKTVDALLGLALIDSTPDISDELRQRIIQRQQARDAKDWAASDRLRHELEESGVLIRDTADGTIWEYAA